MYTFSGLLPPDRILPGANFTLRPSLAFSCIGSIAARHLTSGRQPNFAAWYKEWNYGTFAEGATYIWLGGHHVGHQPTFSFCLVNSHVLYCLVHCVEMQNSCCNWISQMFPSQQFSSFYCPFLWYMSLHTFGWNWVEPGLRWNCNFEILAVISPH